MKTRTSLILAVIAAATAAFIFFFERHQATTSDLTSREERVLPGFDRDQVDRIVLGTGEGRVELERVPESEADAGPPGSVGAWRLTRPRRLDADPEAVDKLLSSIDWLERRRTVDLAKTGKRLAELGLAEPRGQIDVRLRGREVTLKLGGQAPGKGIYLSLGDAGQAYVVDEEFLKQAVLSPGDLRDKRLGRIEVPDVEALRVTGQFHALRRGPDRWDLEAPIKMLARADRVEDVALNLEQLRAARFVADDVRDDQLSRYGLDRPAREVTLRLKGQRSPLTLRFGRECEGHSEEVYATALGTGTVSCVGRQIVSDLGVDPESLRDLRPTTLEAADVERIEISRQGKQLTLRRQGDSWRLGGGANAQDEGVGAEAESVEGFLTALREAAAEDVVTDLTGTGLEGEAEGADVVVRLIRPAGTDQREERLAFALEPTRVLLRRGEEAIALILPVRLEADGTLGADPLRFRDRTLLSEQEGDAEEVEVTSAAPAMHQLLKKQDGVWRVTSPIEHRADDVLVRDVVQAVAELRAERFVAAAPSAEHGLSRPRLRLRVRFASSAPSAPSAEADGGQDGGRDSGAAGAGGPPHDRVVLVGGEAEGGGWYARLEGEDQVVFVVPQAFVERLEGPLVDRNLFALDGEQVQGLVIEREGVPRVELSRSGSEWRAGGAAAPDGAVQAILSRLATVRASEALGFGPPGPETGLRAPRARLFARITADEQNEERVLVIGSSYGEEGARRVYVRREDVDATFAVPERAILPVLEYGQAPTAPDAGAGAEQGGEGEGEGGGGGETSPDAGPAQ